MEFLRTQPPARLENLWAGCQVSAAPGPHARTAPGRSPGVSCWPVRSVPAARRPHAGHHDADDRPQLSRPVDRLRHLLRAPLRTPMIIDYTLGALVAAGLLLYLGYALLKPERF
ncbi:K(+)-transporting ATPase subunit F [Rhodoplanes serenus]|nr:K(+)-transporting ATPase subunit F [Rhodoplanes serenus]